tara:strand:+ start:20038 stop:21795 length:1758 start_codon:yes stop_codon:yes gene_type:complete
MSTISRAEASRYAKAINNLSPEIKAQREKTFDIYVEMNGETPVQVLSVELKNKQKVSLVFKMRADLLKIIEGEKNLNKKVLSEWGCVHCGERFNKLKTFTNSEGNPVFCCMKHETRSNTQCEVYDELKKLIKKYNINFPSKWTFEIVNENTLYSQHEGYEDEEKKTYIHYYNNPSSYSDKLNNFDSIWLPKALNKYSELIYDLLCKVGNIRNVMNSCKELEKLLLKSLYGKKQVPAVEWFISVLEKIIETSPQSKNIYWDSINFTEKFKIIAEVICKSSYTEGDSKSAYIGLFHIVNNYLLDILENGKTPEGVVKMIEYRNSPYNYRRTKGGPSEGNIREAENICKNMINTIETITQLEEHPGCTIVNKEIVNTPENAFAKMREANANKKTKTNKYSDFSKRMSKNNLKYAYKISEIVENVENGTITKVEVITKNVQEVYTAHTSLDKNDLSINCQKIGHLWAYMSLGDVSRLNATEEVSHIYIFKHYNNENIIFIVKNAKERIIRNPVKGNCLFPEQLANKHVGAKKAVEKLNKMTNICIPEEKDISFGVGTGVGYYDGRLTKPIKLIITCGNDEQFEVELKYM